MSARLASGSRSAATNGTNGKHWQKQKPDAPPHSNEAEQATLGGILKDNAVLGPVRAILDRPELFYADANRLVYAAVLALVARGVAVDLVTMGDELHRLGHVEEIGGYGYLAHLIDVCPAAASAVHYATIVKQKAAQRALIQSGAQLHRLGLRPTGPAEEMLSLAGQLVSRISQEYATAREEPEAPGEAWPRPMGAAAFYGVAGDYVDAVLPHTEADGVALLLQLLTGFGNAIGRTLHFRVEGDVHYLNLFVVLLGKTSKGRKGTSWGRVRQYLDLIDSGWAKDRVMGGLSSGEGFVWQIRDEVRAMVPIKGRGGVIERMDETVIDQGVLDKRLLCIEEEYAGVIRLMERQGSSLSQRLREAWQGRRIGSLTKNTQTKCDEPHVSIIGHSSIDEVQRYLTSTEVASGYGNRHLWALVRRSKCLPRGSFHEPDIGDGSVAKLLQAAHLRAVNTSMPATAKELRRDAAADDLWAAIYPDLSEGQPGLAGALLGRSEAYVMRLACLYAGLEQSAWITTRHLESALAVWDYCAESVRIVFGDTTGDPLADEIMRLLRSREGGATRTDMIHHFGRNRSSEEIGRALSVLKRGKLARGESVSTGGRPQERWVLESTNYTK